MDQQIKAGLRHLTERAADADRQRTEREEQRLRDQADARRRHHEDLRRSHAFMMGETPPTRLGD